MEQTKEATGALWLGFIPAMDGQTVISLLIGTIITLVTFWFGYTKTIGAREERIAAANRALASSVLRRIAVEREQMPGDQYEAILRARAYNHNVSPQRLFTFNQVLDHVLSETVDNNFLDRDSKNAIVGLVSGSRSAPAPSPEKAADEPGLFPALTLMLAASSVVLGTAGTAMFDLFRQVIATDGAPLAKPDNMLVTSAILAGVTLLLSMTIVFVRMLTRSTKTGDHASGSIALLIDSMFARRSPRATSSDK